MESLDFGKIAKQFTNYHRLLPAKVGAIAVDFYKQSFRRQGYIDKAYKRWDERKKTDKRRKGRAIMVDTGTLRRSIRVSYKGRDYVVIGSNMPYAKIHNEGGIISHPGTKRTLNFRRDKKGMRFAKSTATNIVAQAKVEGKPYTIKIPQRQFMGASQFLERRIEAIITHDLKKMFGV